MKPRQQVGLLLSALFLSLFIVLTVLSPRGFASQSKASSAGPSDPHSMGSSPHPQVVLLHAPWCQWCMVLEREVIPTALVQAALKGKWAFYDVDVDEAPLWMDLPEVTGLPALVFFDSKGRYIIAKSGYRSAEELASLLDAVAGQITGGELLPEAAVEALHLSTEALSSEAAKAELKRLEQQIYFQINSNDGAFGSPARLPYPDLLLALQGWTALGATDRVDSWIALTLAGALRGTSPRLTSNPLPDMDYDAEELIRLSRLGSAGGQRWLEGIEGLPEADAYLGIQDQIDHGVFRYAAGPGWYHPHFERRVLDNLSWVALLAARGEAKRSQEIGDWALKTFGDGPLLNTVQRSDPFYYRLRAEERKGVPAPIVDRRWTLKVQARAARVWPKRCDLLKRVEMGRWPRLLWTQSGEDPAGPEATPDAVGELLLALSSCTGDWVAGAISELDKSSVERWEAGFPPSPRLNRLAAGLCAVGSSSCARALNTVAGMRPSGSFPPPLIALDNRANQRVFLNDSNPEK